MIQTIPKKIDHYIREIDKCINLIDNKEMSEKLSIKINIANRFIPQKVNKESEEHIRLAAKNIEERIKFYENNYEINDKQDLLAIVLLNLQQKLKVKVKITKKERSDISDDLNQINNILSEKLS